MTKRMLIDAAHPEETRVVVLDGTRLEEFDLETAHRRPLKGNIYLAKVVRVEPSLQAAFVEYGGNRHGFLAFGEIHPDYYQIPVADRQRLIALQAAEARAEDEAEERAAQQREAREAGRRQRATPEAEATEPSPAMADEAGEAAPDSDAEAAPAEAPGPAQDPQAQPLSVAVERVEGEVMAPAVPSEAAEAEPEAREDARAADAAREDAAEEAAEDAAFAAQRARDETSEELAEEDRAPEAPPPELLGGEDPGPEETDAEGEGEGRSERRAPPNFMRHYKIQEVIRRRQILLIQVVKEERGSKGAALTTFISLAGRFSVLMPNSPRGGGVSRKITSATDRKRLREAIDEVGLPDGMSLIVRTAGANRPKPEIKRDCEYLLRLWDSIRERTLASSAPALIYEEADLIKRSIRDVFSRDVDELVVEGDDAFQQAREFMRMLMPANAQKVRLHREPTPLFARHGVDAALDAMNSPTVQLRSGGYVVINQTEALVAIDVNSGRATRERHIEDTALRTNLEAAEEIARQLRLRDLAGLIVIDFIDMESSRHDAMVEKRLKDQLRHDRARIQVGRISHFGLLEMSRQRLRPSIAEHNTVACVHCQGRGFVRSIESSALQALRAIEEEGARRRSAEIVVHMAGPVALYLLNRKRDRLAQIEERWMMAVSLMPDETLVAPALRIERLRAQSPDAVMAAPSALRMDYAAPEPEEAEEVEAIAEADTPAEAAPAGASAPETAEEAERRRRRRRRRGGRGRREDGAPGEAAMEGGDEGSEASATETADEASAIEDAPLGAEAITASQPTLPEASPPLVSATPSTEAPAPAAMAEESDAAESEDEADAGEAAPRIGPNGERLDENGRRRRGRRGGRRRRGDPELRAEEAVPAPIVPPSPQPRAERPAPPPRPERAPRDDRSNYAPREDRAAPAPRDDRPPYRPREERVAPPPPRYVGPTPANPFAGQADDIFSVMEAAEAAAEAQAAAAARAAKRPAEAEPPAPAAASDPAPAAPAPASEPATPEPVTPEPVVAAPPIQPIVLDEAVVEALPKRSGWWKK